MEKPTTYRSAGHRALIELPQSAGEVAAATGASRSTITALRRQESRPSPELRRSLAEHFRIPVASWDTLASTPTPDAPPPAPPTGPPTIEQLHELMATLEDARRQPGLTPGELAKLSSEIRHLVTAIAAHARLDRESDERIRARALAMVEPLRAAILGIVGHHPEVAGELLDCIDARMSRAR